MNIIHFGHKNKIVKWEIMVSIKNINISDCTLRNVGRIINEAIVLHPLRRDHNNHESVYFTFLWCVSHMWNASIVKKSDKVMMIN